ncbi:MAG: hypothetical protein AB1515_08120 [Nitrospirota bacterium]
MSFKIMPGLLLVALALLNACGAVLVPEAGQTGRVDVGARVITKESGGIQITVQSMAWQYDPYYLEDFFTPMLVFVRNTTEEPVALRYQDFVLIDERGNQFNAVAPQTVERVMRGRGYPYLYPPQFFYPPPGIHPYGMDPRAAHADIMLLGLTENTVLPHAQVRGFLYFQKAVIDNQQLTLSASVAGQRQEFRFTVER